MADTPRRREPLRARPQPTAPAPPPPPDQPPAPGYWKASDGNWYPPQGPVRAPEPPPPPPPDQPPAPGYWKASDGNWYPPQSAAVGVPAPPGAAGKGRSGCLKVGAIGLAGLVALIVIVVVATGGGDDDDEGAEDRNGAGAAEDTHAVGDTATSDVFELTLNTVQDPFTPTNQFEAPPEGQRFVAVEITARNTSDEAQTLSTLLGAEMKDAQNRAWNIAIAGTELPQLDGTLQPGETRRGWIVFSVAQDSSGLQLRLKGSLTARGALFVL